MLRRNFRGIITAALAFAFVVLAVSCCPNTFVEGQIVMGFVPSEDAEVVQEQMVKMVGILTEMTGIPIKPVLTPNYNILVDAIRVGEVQVAWMPPLAYVQAEDEGIATVVLKAVRRGNPWYYGAIIVRKDSGINDIQDLRGKSIAWGDIKSFSGHIYPKAALIKQGIDPDRFFGTQRHLKSHPAVVISVFNGDLDAGGCFSNNTDGTDGAWTQTLKDPEKYNQIKVLLYTPPIPGDTVAVATEYMADHPTDADKIVRAIFHLNDHPVGKKILMDIYHIERLVLAKPADYQVVRDAAKLVIED